MTPVILSELDDTLLKTLKASALPDRAADPYVQLLRGMIDAGAAFVPVTNRRGEDLDQDAFSEGAVLAHGAVILDADGTEDLSWSRHVVQICERSEYLLDAAEKLLSRAPIDVRFQRYEHNGALLGMTVLANEKTAEGISLHLRMAREIFRQTYRHADVTFYLRGDALTLMPSGISKRAAVQYLLSVRDDLRDRPTIGVGHCPDDLPFMELCSVLMLPREAAPAQKLLA